MTLSITRLDAFTLPVFSGLIAPEVLEAAREGDPLRIALGASDEDGGAGTLLLDLHMPTEAHVLWLFVRKAQRRRGIATALLAASEAIARQAERSRLALLYPSGQHEEAWQRLIERAGFGKAARSVLRFRARITFASDPWVCTAQVRAPLALVPWSELGAEPLASVSGIESQLPRALHPSPLQAYFDRETSFALLSDRRVVGWVIAFADGDAMHIATLYVAPELRKTGAALALVSAAAQRQLVLRGAETFLTAAVAPDNAAILHVLHKLERFVVSVIEQHPCEKSLAGSSLP